MSYDFEQYDWEERRRHLYDTSGIARSNRERATASSAPALPPVPVRVSFTPGPMGDRQFEQARDEWIARYYGYGSGSRFGLYEVKRADADGSAYETKRAPGASEVKQVWGGAGGGADPAEEGEPATERKRASVRVTVPQERQGRVVKISEDREVDAST